MEIEDQVAALQISSANAWQLNTAIVSALLVECAVIPTGTVSPDAEYASLIQDWIVEPIAVVDIHKPRLGDEILTNRKSIFWIESIWSR